MKDGVRNLCEEKIDGVKSISKDMDWLIFVICVAHF